MSETDSRLYECYEQMLALCPQFEPTIIPTDQSTLIASFHEVNQYFLGTDVTKNRSPAPAGNWYMGTLTSKPQDTVHSMMMNHKAIMNSRYGPYVVYAVHEKSNIHHVHYIFNLPKYADKMERDLRTLTNRIVKIEDRAKTLKRWRGMCKYLLKREYSNGKEDTTVAVLKAGISYTKGKGYKIL